jgi:hypothetical protein
MLPQDRRVDENATEQDITQRVAAKLQHLDAPRRPQAQPRRVGARLRFEAYGLQTDDAQVRPDGTPRLASDNVSPPYRDIMDNELVRARFVLDGSQRYSLAQADEMLQRRFGDDLVLRTACKTRLATLGLLSGDDGLTGRVPDPRILEARGQRQGDLRASAEDLPPRGRTGAVRTNRRGILIDAAGKPITLRSQPD